MSASLLSCALSGETPPVDPVVTPSGFICSRRLLLSKLTENGGVDPFDKSSNPRTLDESDLIELNLGGKAGDGGAKAKEQESVIPPRLPSAASLPSLLSTVQSEYDSVLLELYDTRRTLEETRRELSQALYQNDAAVRVVARLAMERDGAREQLAAMSANLEAAKAQMAAGPALVPETQGQKRPREDDAEAVGQPGPKKPAVVEPEAASAASNDNDETAGPSNKIPASDLDNMVSLWKTLSKGRKKKAKAEKTEEGKDAEGALTIDAIKEYGETSKKSLHKSNAKAGVLALATSIAEDGALLVTGGHDKHAVVYDTATGKVVSTLVGAAKDVTAVDILRTTEGESSKVIVATGSADGGVTVYSTNSDGEYELVGSVGDIDDAGTSIVGVSIQPTGKYILAATASGKIAFLSILDDDMPDRKLKLTAVLGEAEVEYTCGGLHPDGLIYGVGTADGKLKIWDLKSQALAGTLECKGDQAVTSLSFSENGYHFASSTADGTVQVWDLRKLKNVATLNDDGAADGHVGQVKAVSFDPSGKFLAYGGANGSVTVAVVKDWDNRAVLTGTAKGAKKAVTGLAWGRRGGKASIITCSDAERPVRFWGDSSS